MTKEDNIIVPRWFLEAVENTLQIQNNINLDEKTGETCQDRNIKESLNGIRKLLMNEELTGGERLERLHQSLPSNLDEAAEDWCKTNNKGIALSTDKKSHYLAEGEDAFKAGAEWMAGQGVQDSIEGTICGRVHDHVNVKFPDWIGQTLEPKSVSHIPANVKNYNIGDEVVVQIRKKQ